jgi:hypothetical protein
MVVIVVRLNLYSAPGMRFRVSVSGKKMRVNLAGMSVAAMIGAAVDVLKRRKDESQQECQARLDGYRATHH